MNTLREDRNKTDYKNAISLTKARQTQNYTENELDKSYVYKTKQKKGGGGGQKTQFCKPYSVPS